MQIFPALIQQDSKNGLSGQLDSGSSKAAADFAAWLDSSQEQKADLQAWAKDSGSSQGLSLEKILQALGQELDSKQLQGLLSFLQENQQIRQRLLQALEGENLSSEQRMLQGLLQELEQASGIPDQDQELVQELLQKLGLEKEKAQEAVLALQEGDSARFWQLLDQGLQDLPQDKGLQLEKGEVFALARVLGLDKEQGLEMASSLSRSRELDPQKLQQILDDVRQEQTRQANKALQQLLDKLQALQSEQAKGQSGDTSRQDSGRMLQELERIVRQALESPAKAGGAEQGRSDGAKGAVQGEGPWISDLKQQKVQERAQSEHRTGSRTEQPAQAGQEQRLQSGGKEFQQGREFSAFKDSSSQDWSKFWERLQHTEKQDKGNTDWRLFFQGQDRSQAMQQEARAEAQKTDLLKDGRLRQEVLRQIQDGVLRNLGSGRQELSLRLHPPDLGRVDVVLQLQGKELSALLKTNNQEVGRMLQQQLSSLQQMLEQQGIKVQKLDVQTQLAQEGSGQQWMGEKKHNQAQENREKHKQWSLRRRLDLLENGLGSEEVMAAAQE
ncbi:MAG: flagellar hook-length control protein FliK, partial [Desulfohalobiaceae bacterium]